MADGTPEVASEAFREKVTEAKTDLKKLLSLIGSANNAAELALAAEALNTQGKATEETKTLFRSKVEALKISKEVEDDKKLAATEQRLSKLLEMLEAPVQATMTPVEPPAEKNFLGRTADMIGGAFGMAKTLAENAFEAMPDGMKSFVYSMLASPAKLNIGLENIWGIDSIVDYAKQKLAILDIKQAMTKARVQNSEFIFNGVFSAEEWDEFNNNFQNQKISTLTYKFIKRVRDAKQAAGIPAAESAKSPEVITLSKLMETPERAQQRIAEIQNESKNTAFKNRYVLIDRTVTFNSSETSYEKNGVLNVLYSEVSADGKVQEGSRAKTLLDAKDALENAEKIVIGEAPVSLDWRGGKRIVTLPGKIDAALLSTINELIGKNPDSFRVLQISNDFSMSSKRVMLKKNTDGSALLEAKEDTAVLNAIAQGTLTGALDGRSEALFELNSSNDGFSDITDKKPV